MHRVRLIHWNAAEAAERLTQLKAAGYDTVCRPIRGMPSLREIGDHPPAALVDFKISAVDADWAGLRFTRRKAK